MPRQVCSSNRLFTPCGCASRPLVVRSRFLVSWSWFRALFCSAVALSAGLASPQIAWGAQYPPGPPSRFCPDSLTLFQLQQIDTTLAPCHPTVPDTVYGVRGIITAFDAKPTGFSFYIQNTFASGPKPWTGIDVFTGATNYNASVPGTPSGGNLALGDSVVIYGKMQEFTGESEIEGFDAAQATNDIIIRKISSGNALPLANTGTTATFNWIPAISAGTAEPWEGCLVRINGPLRVGRTAGSGITANLFLVANPAMPVDSVLIDGFTLTTFAAPPVGTDVDYVQGILNQRTTGGVNSYRIQLRDLNDISVAAPPNLVYAYPIEDNRLRLVFDKAVDLATAENEANYSLASLGSINLATRLVGAEQIVELDITTSLSDGDAEQVFTANIGSAACPTCLSTPQSRAFRNGVMAIATIQAPDPTRLSGPCEDRSRFAGAGAVPGDMLTVRGIAVQSYGSLYYITDPSGGARSGVTVFAPASPLITGRRYRLAGTVQEFQGETEIVSIVDYANEGVAPVPLPIVQTIAGLRDTTCDSGQSLSTGEDYEGVLVQVRGARVVPFNTPPTDPTPGGSFRVIPAPGSPDTILVSNLGSHYSFDADPGEVLDVTGILHYVSGSFRILPRGDADLALSETIAPDRGGNAGSVSAVISGFGFQGGATVKLARSPYADVVGTQVSVAPDGRSIAAVFDLTGKAVGSWDVVVTNPGPNELRLANGFTIEAAAAAQLRVDVIGPALIRPNRRKAFDIVIENQGNGDLTAVPLWITRIPTSATIEVDFPVTPPPQSGGEPDWSQAPLTLTGPGGKYLALVIPRVPPGTTLRRIYLTVPNTLTSFELDAALTPPWADGAVFRGCLSGGGVITNPACMGTQLTAINAYLAATPGIEALSGIGLWAKIAWQCEGAATLPAALVKAEQVLDFMLQPLEQAGMPSGCEAALAPRWQDARTVEVVTSVDPNDKLGIGGHGGGQIGAGQALSYSIRFENLETATAPAQDVVVSDPLDLGTLDPSTVSLDIITFGNVHIVPPPGLKSYATQVDLRPGRNLLVQVSAGLDPFTGVLTWYFSSIDPATGQPPTDPLAGFLPPNVTPPQGEGSVLFTVMPKAGLGGGAVVRNRANIDFDGVSLLTPEWSNTMDMTAPQSQVLPLGANQDSVAFTVHWQPSGIPPDLRDFSVYVSENGGGFRPWRLFTRATADTFAGPGGRTYAFYSLARDSSGNLEPVPGTPDAQTYSRVAVDTEERLMLALEGALPNPATGAARVWFTLPSRERAVLEVIDLAGRRMLRREVGELGPGRHGLDVSAAVRRPGLYFLRLAQAGRALRTRMVVIR